MKAASFLDLDSPPAAKLYDSIHFSASSCTLAMKVDRPSVTSTWLPLASQESPLGLQKLSLSQSSYSRGA